MGWQLNDRADAAGSSGVDAASSRGSWTRPDALLAGFLMVYIVCALVAQTIATTQRGVSPSEEGAPIEAFTSGLLWIIAMYGLVRASQSLETGRRTAFWLVFTAAIGALAVDEIIGVHEATEPGFNDDWVKVLMWIATPLVLAYVARIERAPRITRIAMLVGYVLQTAYIVVETGDGEVFSLPFSADRLKTSEEVFELLFLAAYAFALWILILRPRVQLDESSGSVTGHVAQ